MENTDMILSISKINTKIFIPLKIKQILKLLLITKFLFFL